jgi:4-diphosphocytidyl-2-C-methyl-D-erythritol kinase
MPDLPRGFDAVGAVAAFLRGARNDLQAPAVTLQPAIGEVLAALASQPEPLLTRMSGSGATCFSLCGGPNEALRLADRLGARHPSWWVRNCRLAVQGLRNR